MAQITAYEQVSQLKQGDTLIKVFSDGGTSYKVSQNNHTGDMLWLLPLPLRYNEENPNVIETMPISRTYQDLVNNGWHFLNSN